MPKAVIELSERATRVVNVVKAKEGLKNKSQAIERIVAEFEEIILDPNLRPEFVEDVQRIRKGRFKEVGDLAELVGGKR